MRGRTDSIRDLGGVAARASWTGTDWLRSLAVALGVALFLAYAGAFGTGRAPPAVRFTYWIALMTAGTFVSRGVFRLTTSASWLDNRPRLQLLVGTIGMAVVYTGIVWAASVWTFDLRPNLADLAWYFPPVLAVSALATTLNVLTARRPFETHAAAAGAPPPRFLERLPPKLVGAELYAVEAEDHYLRLHTSKGEDLILMRLSDAVAELEGIEGARTHRSWWVARGAVEGASRGDGRAVLRLKSGAEAPVSRSYAKALRDEGWF